MLWSTKVTWEVDFVLPIHFTATDQCSFFILLSFLCNVFRGTDLSKQKARKQGPCSALLIVCREEGAGADAPCHYSLFQGQQ